MLYDTVPREREHVCIIFVLPVQQSLMNIETEEYLGDKGMSLRMALSNPVCYLNKIILEKIC